MGCELFWCLGWLCFGLVLGLFVVIYDGLFIWLSGLGGLLLVLCGVYCAVWFV